MSDPIATLQNVVAELDEQLAVLMKQCDDPQGASLVELLGDIRSARERLYGLEQTIERTAVKAMFDDRLTTGRYVAERYRSRDRKEWRHEDWQRDVRDKAMRKHGLLNAEIVDEGGELVKAAPVVFEALADVQAVHATTGPKVTGLRTLGLSADDYCSTSAGRAGVRTKLVGDEGDA